MNSNSLNGKKSLVKESNFLLTLSVRAINSIAKACGFLKRKSEKITPHNLLIGFMLMVSKKRNTYENWATEIGLLCSKTVSKQAVEQRMQESIVEFAKGILYRLHIQYSPISARPHCSIFM